MPLKVNCQNLTCDFAHASEGFAKSQWVNSRVVFNSDLRVAKTPRQSFGKQPGSDELGRIKGRYRG